MKPTAFHMIPESKYPVRITVYSALGHELWTALIERPAKGELHAIQIPGYGGTEHVPVTTRIEYADGTSEQA